MYTSVHPNRISRMSLYTFRDSAESTRRRASGSKQQLYGTSDVGQTDSQLGISERVRGQRDHAQVVRRHENVPGQRRQQSINCHAPQHPSEGKACHYYNAHIMLQLRPLENSWAPYSF